MKRDAFKMSKQELFEVGQELTEAFLQRNGLCVPRYRAGSLNTPHKPRGIYGCGYYANAPGEGGTICVDPFACASPSLGNGRQRSFPTYSTDRTPVGVVAHEAGHAIERFTGVSRQEDWQKLLRPKDRISSYEPNYSEAFAESMRIFILNPALLRVLSPARFRYLGENLWATNDVRDPRVVLEAWSAPKTYIDTVTKRMQK